MVRKLRAILTGIAAVMSISLLTGCSSDECTQNRNALPLAGFYSSAEGHSKLTVDSVSVAGVDVPGDSILSDGKKRISQLYLPFRLDRDTTRYVFSYLQKELAAMDLKDTVTFIYTRNPRFVSAACGVSYVFTMQEIRHTNMIIDSVACPAGEINNMATQNLEIYFRTAETETQMSVHRLIER